MWTGPTFQTYYRNIHRIVGEKLDKEDSSYLLQVDFDEYLNFLVDEAKWEPLLWDESQMTVEPFVTKRQRRDEAVSHNWWKFLQTYPTLMLS